MGEHTDYGLLTMLRQDDVGGLQVRTTPAGSRRRRCAASFVCNIGDMLDRMTGGLLPLHAASRAPQHERPRSLVDPAVLRSRLRVARGAGAGRSAGTDDSGRRWDGANLQAFEGTYGDYVSAKVGKVFPELKQRVAQGKQGS